MKGQILYGQFGKLIAREKADQKLELGELVIAPTREGKILLQVFDLMYGSQISQQNLELISGMSLEEDTNADFFDSEIRNYNLALLKGLITINGPTARICKSLPNFFSPLLEVKEQDLKFLTKPKNPLYVGNLRSGSKVLDVGIYLDGVKAFSHHILIPATTGKGKSNLMSCMLWDSIDKDYCGILVLDPHDEYYGRIKNHPTKNNIVYYRPKDAPPGGKTLRINLELIRPAHFNGVVDWSQAQREGLAAFYHKYQKKWIEAIILEKPVDGFNEATLAVLRRRMLRLLDIDFADNQLFFNGIFQLKSGISTLRDIGQELEASKTVIIDTSGYAGEIEILIGSLISTEVFNKYKHYKTEGTLRDKPVISIILEEAPRVLGKEVLEKGPNIFSTIAREGRKFKVGLTAITQLPSLIPRQILANINTKIILGIEMKPERQAIIDSAAQDLSEDDRNIASLDVGEAILSSNFARFATPIKISLFDNFSRKDKSDSPRDFSGIKLS